MARPVARFLSCQPDAPDGRCWLVLAIGARGGTGRPVFTVESSHARLADARDALARANRAALRLVEAAPRRGSHRETEG